jgi:plastocyanin
MKTNFTFSKQILRNLIIISALMLLTISQLVAQSKHIVEVTQNVFTPDELNIIAGDTVEWRNTDGYHNVNGTTDTYPSNPESFGNSPGNGWTYSHVFTIPGEYDYQCDPHVGLGMVGKIVVKEADDNGEKHMLTINFTGMNPHIGQNLHLAVIEKNSRMEISRLDTIAQADFMVHVYGIENGMSYNVDFYADHNSNGMYDAPPTDHAWRLDLDDVTGDTTLNFAHNTNFTDIMWQNRLTVHFTGMNPHVGQYFWVGLVDQESGTLTDSIETTASVDFMVHLYGIENGMSYNVDFYADHNSNGMYDAPPTDHAWRLELENVMGDTTLTFTHNTNFTDIFETTSISEKGINQLRLYPNPATDVVSIELNEQNLRDFNLSVYDIAGKLNHIVPTRSNNKIEFSVLHLKRGMYFVELKTTTLRETIKLIKK